MRPTRRAPPAASRFYPDCSANEPRLRDAGNAREALEESYYQAFRPYARELVSGDALPESATK